MLIDQWNEDTWEELAGTILSILNIVKQWRKMTVDSKTENAKPERLDDARQGSSSALWPKAGTTRS